MGKQGKEIKYPQLGSNLRLLRVVRKLTQEGISAELGVKRTAYAMWEAGISRPNPIDEKRIANFYHITVDDLYNAVLSEKEIRVLGLDKPESTSADPWKDKYISSLEEQKDMIREIGEVAAKAAVDRLAANYATKDDVKAVSASLGRLRKEVENGTREQQNVRLFLLSRIAALEGVDVDVVDTALDNEMLAYHKPQSKNKKAAAGR